MNKNIEDLFKDGFEGFEQQPKKDMWDKIVQQRQINNLTNNPSHEVTPEHIYSKEFKNFEQQPAEKVWRNVLLHINNRRQQKRYVRWSLLLLLLIGSCGSLVWLYDGKGDANTNLAMAESNNEKATTKTSEELNIIASPQTNMSNNLTSKKENLNTKTHNNTNTFNAVKRTDNNHSAERGFERIIEKVNQQNSNIDVQNSTTIDHNIVDKNVATVKEAKPNDAVKDIVPATKQEIAKNTIVLKPDSIQTASADIKKKDRKKPITDMKGDKKWWHGPSYFKYTSETDMNNEESNWKFGASAGFEWPRVQFKGNSNDPLYSQFRKDDESRAASYNAQAFAIRQLGKLLFVQSGFGYSSFGFTGDYRHSIYTVQDSITPGGNHIPDTLYSYKINAQSQYRINYLEIPIILGFHLGDLRTNFDIKCGYILQYLASQSGSALSPTTHQLEPIGASNQLTANRFGASGLVTGKLNHQIKHELSIFIELSYRYNLNALMGNAAQQQYINSWGLNTGIKFHID